MIANITWGADFGGLVRYLVENRDHEVLDLQGVSAIDLAADEMAAVAALNDRATNKLLHLSLSAAHEDGRLEADQWLVAVAQIEQTLCLRGHQRVIVRHRDKTHDHVHVFWCAIAIETGQTPPKQWFLKKGCGVEGIGPHALSKAQVAAVPPANRARRTYDFRALARCMDACRKLERELGLRRLRTPVEAGMARAAGKIDARAAAQRKRSERVGSTPLIDRADEIRAALDRPDWPSKRRAICAIGLDFEPFYRTTKKGTELRGLVIFDPHDRGNRMGASDLDLPNLKFGLRRLEDRHESGTERFEQWWPQRELVTPASSQSQDTDHQRLKRAFDLLHLEHVAAEREKTAQRKQLRKHQALVRAREGYALERRRRAEASLIPANQRKAFYQRYAAEVARPARATLKRSQTHEMRVLARSRKPVWSAFLEMCAAAGDPAAARKIARNHSKPVLKLAQERELVPRQEVEKGLPPAAMEIPFPIPTTCLTALDPADLLRAYQEFLVRGGRE